MDLVHEISFENSIVPMRAIPILRSRHIRFEFREVSVPSKLVAFVESLKGTTLLAGHVGKSGKLGT